MSGVVNPAASKQKVRASLANIKANYSPQDQTDIENEVDALASEIAKLQAEAKKNQSTITTLQQQLNPTSQVDLGDTASIKAYLAGLEAKGDTWEMQREKLSEEVRAALGKGVLMPQSLRDTNISEEIEYNRNRKPDDKCCKLDSNVLNSIPEFTGESETEWRNFEQAWMVAIRNHKVDEGALMTALMPRLKGKAKTFYMAESVRMTNWNFAETMQRLRDRYREEKLQAENRISGMCQNRDSVRDFAARLQVAAYALYPPHPGKLKALMHSEGATIIPNPVLGEETKDYFRMVEKAESSLMKIFMSGLRPDIQARLPSEIYLTFEQMVDGARKAEWIQGGINAGMLQKCSNPLYHVEDEPEGDECHALVKREGNKKFQGKGNTGKTQYNGNCWNCGEFGHTKAECKKPQNQEDSRRNVASYDRFGKFRKGFQPRRNFSSRPMQYQRRSTRFNTSRQMTPKIRNFLRVQKYNGKRSSYKDPTRRRWMTKNRARYNLRRKFEGRLYALNDEEMKDEEVDNLTPEEQELFQLEYEMEEKEFEEYMEEVFQIEEELEMELEGELNAMESKN